MRRFLIAPLIALIVASPAAAELKLPAVFGDSMVLQRELAVPVFGKADPGAEVSVRFGDTEATITASDDGRFRVDLPAMKASAEPRTLTVRSGEDAATFEDVLVGEVWVCSGQSNMQWPVQASLSAEVEAVTADYPNLRLFQIPLVTAPEPADDVDAMWKPATPETVPGFSAVGFFFARTMHQALGVPVGIIQTAWGGTRAEAWTPKEALQAEAELKPILDIWDEQIAQYDEPTAMKRYEEQRAKYEEARKEWEAKSNEERAGSRAPREPQRPTDPNTSQHRYSTLWNKMVHPIVPYGIRGAIWYQGESNAGRAVQYRKLMATMIESWREAWGQGDFPFYQVQLANFMAPSDEPKESAWAELREAQKISADAVGSGDVAVITDIGAAKDIHPKNKQDVAKRLARLALVDVYGMKMTRTGPTLKDAQFGGGKATLTFENIGEGGLRGLVSYYGEPLSGFAITGEDRVWKWADARIVGQDKVVLSHPEIETPVAVRYNWADNPQGTLFNKAYLPAAPFRTDDFDEVTKDSVRP